jgi:very-short-patch-repair endonuclease
MGVKFPDEVKLIFNLTDDYNAEVYFQYPIQRYLCDFVHPSKKVVFRVQGDFWHANPLLYSEDSLTKIQKYNCCRDKNQRKFLEAKGWSVLDIWESDIYWRKDFVKDQAISAVGSTSVLHTEGPQFESGIAYSDEEWSLKLRDMWFKKPKGRPSKKKLKKVCLHCGTPFETRHHKRKYCSYGCASQQRRTVERPSKEQLLKEVAETSYCAVGRKYGVTDNAVRKWLKNFDGLTG